MIHSFDSSYISYLLEWLPVHELADGVAVDHTEHVAEGEQVCDEGETRTTHEVESQHEQRHERSGVELVGGDEQLHLVDEGTGPHEANIVLHLDVEFSVVGQTF
jgi:hypothetical protein